MQSSFGKNGIKHEIKGEQEDDGLDDLFVDEYKDESGISNTAVDVVEEETEKRDSKEVRNEKKKCHEE